MPRVRFNHMELTFPKGSLDAGMREDIARFYGEIFGFTTNPDVDVVGQSSFFIGVDEGQFILLAESSKPMHSPGYDHLGFLCETRAEVDELLERVKKFAEHDDRVDLREYEDLKTDNVTVHAFYVKYLLPIFFDVQCLEYAPGSEPRAGWRWAQS